MGTGCRSGRTAPPSFGDGGEQHILKIRVTLDIPERFDFGQSCTYLGRSAREPLHTVTAGCVRKAVRLKGRLLLLTISSRQRSLAIDCSGEKLDASVRQAVRCYVQEWFDLQRNLAEFYALAAEDILLSRLIQSFRGLRLVRIHNLFQALCWAIIGQQVNLQFAYVLFRRFVETYGDNYTVDGVTYWLFPRPEVVAELEVPALRHLQLTSRKAQYLLGVARLIATGALSKSDLLALNDFEEVQRRLLKVPGVGPWTANYVLLRCLGHVDAFPEADVGLHAAVQNMLNLPNKPSADEVSRLASRWAGWRGYATFYLYRSLL